MGNLSKIRGAFFGLAVGDGLGVPFELVERSVLEKEPVTDMVGMKAHNKPAGTWSDDASMTFCTAEALLDGFDVERMGRNFLLWFDEGYWSADGKAFGSGGTTRAALKKIRDAGPAEGAGMTSPESNGNGSLMRMIPLAFYNEQHRTNHYDNWNRVRASSEITHGNVLACLACYYYVTFAQFLLQGRTKENAYASMRSYFLLVINILSIEQRSFVTKDSLKHFDRLLKSDIHELSSSEIRSGSYVIDSLEASIWCLMTSNSYKDTVLKAVNLGGDSDSTAAIAGGLAGILYGFNDIPSDWVNTIARKDDIEDLCSRFSASLISTTVDEQV